MNNNVIIKSKGNPFRDCLYNWRQVSVNDRFERTLIARHASNSFFEMYQIEKYELYYLVDHVIKTLWRFDHVPVNFFSQLSFYPWYVLLLVFTFRIVRNKLDIDSRNSGVLLFFTFVFVFNI